MVEKGRVWEEESGHGRLSVWEKEVGCTSLRQNVATLCYRKSYLNKAHPLKNSKPHCYFSHEKSCHSNLMITAETDDSMCSLNSPLVVKELFPALIHIRSRLTWCRSACSACNLLDASTSSFRSVINTAGKKMDKKLAQLIWT